MARGKGLQKELELSDEMADFMGKSHSTRAQITKKIWAYVKKHHLQSEEDRRVIEPDDKLATILGGKPISMFKVGSQISKHVYSE